ncbi:MAG TPA: serine/threonine-protein kinase [Chthoniobacteraceae bacterium]|jgi:WD40 repeat protein/serine/threonine protein kinase|nr:serine/threonine-protein kinase [Chthoniobacteraceae bacterium]
MKTWLSKFLGKSQQPAPTPVGVDTGMDRTIPANFEQTIPASVSGDPQASRAAEAHVAVEWQVGDVIRSLYEIREIHEGGGMGLVYRVHHRDWGKDMAVKSPRAEYFRSERQIENFVRECLTWVGLGLHAHIVCCYYVRMLGGIPRVFAEYVEGGSLKEWIETKRLYEGGAKKTLERVLDVAIQIAWGLTYAHERGLIHQDVKPANVMLTAEGLVKVADFGLAKARVVAGEASSVAGEASVWATSGGLTPAYCSPEQAVMAAQLKSGTPADEMAKLTRHTDIWSWSLSVLEMFMGEPPCQHGQTAAEVFEEYARFEWANPALPRMPVGLVELMRHCFQRDPAGRPGNFYVIEGCLRKIYCEAVGREYERAAPERVESLADALNNEGISLLDLALHDAAEVKFAEALESDPHHPEASYNQGLLLWRSGRITDQQLVTRLEEAAESGAASARVGYMLGLTHIERGDAEAAICALEGLPGKKSLEALELARSGLNKWDRHMRAFEKIDSEITSVSISADGHLALSASWDKTLRLWEVATGICLRTFEGHARYGHPAAISPDARWDTKFESELSPFYMPSAAISPDARLGLLGSEDKTLRLWELATGDCLRTLEGHEECVNSVAISLEGRLGLSGSEDKTLRLWELATGKCLRTFEGHTSSVLSVACSADGRCALSGSLDRTLRLWELATGECLRTFEGHTECVRSVACSADGRWALSGSGDKTLRLWELATGKCVRTFEGHGENVTSVAFSPDGRWAISGSWDHTMRVWELGSGKCLRTFKATVSSVAISPDGGFALSGSDEILRLWELAPGVTQDWVEAEPSGMNELIKRSRQVKEFLTTARTAIQSDDFAGSLAALQLARAVPGYERHPDVMKPWGIIAQHGRTTGLLGSRCLRTLEDHTDAVSSVAISPDGRWALSGSRDDTLRLWEFGTGQCLWHSNNYFVTSVRISADGRWALSGSRVNCVRLLELATGQHLRTFHGHGEAVTSVAFSPDDRFGLSGSEDKTLRLWELATGKCLRTFEGHTDFVASVAISPDGKLGLSGSEDKTLRLWELATGKCLRTFEGHKFKVSSVAITPDGRWALSGSRDFTLRLWEVRTGRCFRTFEGLDGMVSSVAISADGRWALSAQGKTLRLWELATGKCLRNFEGHGECVTSVAFSPDGRWAVSGSEDRTLRFWELDWGYEVPPVADFDAGIIPYLDTFLELHRPVGSDGFTRGGKPEWTKNDFEKLFAEIQHRGFGWLRPEGVRRALETMAARWEGPATATVGTGTSAPARALLLLLRSRLSALQHH